MSSPDAARILVVEDTIGNIQGISAILKRAGYQLRIARNGTQGLKIAAWNSPGRILITAAIHELIKHQFQCEPRGLVERR